MNKKILKELTKADLVHVIANLMYSRKFDFTDEAWFTKEESEMLNRIGNACIKHCESIGDFSLPKV